MNEKVEATLPRLVQRVLAAFLAGTLGGVRMWG